MNNINEVPVGSGGRKEGDVRRRRIPPAQSLANFPVPDLVVDQKINSKKNSSKLSRSEQQVASILKDDIKNEKDKPEIKFLVSEKQKIKKKKDRSKTVLENKPDKIVKNIANLPSENSSHVKLQDKSLSKINIETPNIFIASPSEVELEKHENESKKNDLKKLLEEDKSFSGTKIEFNNEENTYWPAVDNIDEEDTDSSNKNSYNHGFGFVSTEKDENDLPETPVNPAKHNNDGLAPKENKQKGKSATDIDKSQEKNLKLVHRSKSEYIQGHKKELKPSSNNILQGNEKSKQLLIEKISLESAKPSSYTNYGQSKTKFSEIDTNDFEMSEERLSKVFVSEIVNKNGKVEPILIKAKDNCNKVEKPSSNTSCAQSKSKYSEIDNNVFLPNNNGELRPILIKAENSCNNMENDIGFIARSCTPLNNFLHRGQEIFNSLLTNIEPYKTIDDACKQLSTPKNKCLSSIPSNEREELISYLDKIERKLNLLSCEVENLKQSQNIYRTVKNSNDFLKEIKPTNHSEKELQLLKYEFLFAPVFYHNVQVPQESSYTIEAIQAKHPYQKKEFKEVDKRSDKNISQTSVSKVFVSEVRNKEGKIEPILLEKKAVKENPVDYNKSELKTGKSSQKLIVSKRALKYKKKENVLFYPHQPVSTYIPDIRSSENEIIKINEVNWSNTIEPRRSIMKRKHSDLSIATTPVKNERRVNCDNVCDEDSKDFFIGFC